MTVAHLFYLKMHACRVSSIGGGGGNKKKMYSTKIGKCLKLIVCTRYYNDNLLGFQHVTIMSSLFSQVKRTKNLIRS